MSKADLTVNIAEKLNLDINLLNVISSSSKNFYAKRNKDMRINVEKYENNFYIKSPDIYQEFRKVIEEYWIDGDYN